MMYLEKIGILTSQESWFFKYAEEFRDYLEWFGYKSFLYKHHKEIKENLDVLFILSYFHIVPKDITKRNKYNLVVHESDLPKGKGWAPLFWQILEGKNKIPIVLIEASEKIDSGKIYLKDFIELDGYELHDEIRKKQAKKTIEICIQFLKTYKDIIPIHQYGEESYYRRRTPQDSQLDINKTIKEQFNLLRIVDNESYPAFFVIDERKYILKIYRSEE